MDYQGTQPRYSGTGIDGRVTINDSGRVAFSTGVYDEPGVSAVNGVVMTGDGASPTRIATNLSTPANFTYSSPSINNAAS